MEMSALRATDPERAGTSWGGEMTLAEVAERNAELIALRDRAASRLATADPPVRSGLKRTTEARNDPSGAVP